MTFGQAAAARANGFRVEMRYVALDNFYLHMNRVRARAFASGDSASETALRRIYNASLSNLPQAIHDMDRFWAYDNSQPGGHPRLVLEAMGGKIVFTADPVPAWPANALY